MFERANRFLLILMWVLLLSALSASPLRAAIFDTTFVNSGGGNWNDAANWSAGVPDANKTANIQMVGTAGTVTVNGDCVCKNLTISNGTLLIGTGNSLTTGRFGVAAGSFLMTGGTLNLTNSFGSAGGSVLLFGGTVDYQQATGLQTIATFPYINLNVSGGATFSLAGDTLVKSAFTHTAGDLSLAGYTLTVQGNVTRDGGTFTHANGKVVLSGATNCAFGGTQSTTVYDLTVSKTGSGTVTVNTAPTVAGEMLITSGGFTYSNKTLILEGNWTRNGGTIINSGAVEQFSGAGDSVIGGSTTSNFSHLTVAKSGATVTASVNVSAIAFTMTSGTYSAGATTLAVSGTWTNNGGTFSAGTGTVSFTGATEGEIGGSQQTTFYRFQVDKLGEIVGELEGAGEVEAGNEWAVEFDIMPISDELHLSTSIVVNQDVILNSGALYAGSAQISVGGHWYSYGGQFVGETGTVVFTGTGAGNVGGTVSTTFNHVTAQRTGAGSVTLQLNTVIAGDLLVSTGSVIQSASTLTVHGNFTRNNTGTFTSGTNTVVFAGSLDSVVTNAVFYHLTISKTSVSYSVTLSTATTVNGNLTLTNGVFNRNGQLSYFYGNWTHNGGSFTGGSGWWTWFYGSSTATVSGAVNTSFEYIIISKSGGTLNWANGSTVASNFVLSGGTLNFSAAGTLPGVSRTLSGNGTKVIFSGTENQNLSFGTTYGNYYGLEINKTGGTATLSGVSTPYAGYSLSFGAYVGAGGVTFTKGNVSLSGINQGIFTTGSVTFANDASVNVSTSDAHIAFFGYWTKGAAATYAPGGTVSNAISYGTGLSLISASNFQNLVAAKWGGGLTRATGAWTVSQGFTVFDFNYGQSNTVELMSYNHSFGVIYPRGIPEGGSVNAGLLKLQTSTTTITTTGGILVSAWGDAATQQLDFGSSTLIYAMSGNATLPTGYPMSNLQINPSNNSAVISLTGPLVVQRNLTLSSGTLDVTASNYALSVGGNLADGAGTFNPRAGTVTFTDGLSPAAVTGDMNFHNVVLDKYTPFLAIELDVPAIENAGAPSEVDGDDDAGDEEEEEEEEEEDEELYPGELDWQVGGDITGTITLTAGKFVLTAEVDCYDDTTVEAAGELILSTGAEMAFYDAARDIVVNGGRFESSPASGVATLTGDSVSGGFVRVLVNDGSTVDVDSLYVSGLYSEGMVFTEVGNFVKFQNVEFADGKAAQYLMFVDTSLQLTCPGIVFDASVIDQGGYNVVVEDGDLGSDTYLVFEDTGANGAGAGDAHDLDGDKGDGGDAVAGDGYCDYGQGVINWVAGKIFSVRSIVGTPNAGSELLGHPRPVIDYNTFAVIGYVMGLRDADTAGNDLVVLVDTAGNYLDSVVVPTALGDLTGVAVSTANENGTSGDIDGDGVAGEDQLHTLVYATTDTAQILRRLVVGGAFAVCGAPSGWDTPYDGGGMDLVAFTSPPTADNLNIYCGVVDSGGVYCLIWMDHSDASRTLGKSQTPDSCPALQTSLLIYPLEDTPKAYAGSSLSTEDEMAHFYRIDAGLDQVIELDFPVGDPVQGVPALRNNQVSFGTDGGLIFTLDFDDLTEIASYTGPASPVTGGLFVDHLNKKYYGNDAGDLISLDASNGLRYQAAALGAPIRGTPVAAAGQVFVPVGDTMYVINDNPASPSIVRRIRGNGTLSATIVNSFNPGGPKVATFSSQGYFVQY